MLNYKFPYLKIETVKKLLLLIIALVISSQTIKAQKVELDANGVTIKLTGTKVPSPHLIQASPRGTLEWFAIVDNSTRINYNYQTNQTS
jgi:hypothetical protein